MFAPFWLQGVLEYFDFRSPVSIFLCFNFEIPVTRCVRMRLYIHLCWASRFARTSTPDYSEEFFVHFESSEHICVFVSVVSVPEKKPCP